MDVMRDVALFTFCFRESLSSYYLWPKGRAASSTEEVDDETARGQRPDVLDLQSSSASPWVLGPKAMYYQGLDRSPATSLSV